MRALVLAVLCLALAAGEYAPKPDQIVLYEWSTAQSAQWKSAGDELRYKTDIVWHLALRCRTVDGPNMTLAATFIDVLATHKGPGTDIRVDSRSGAGTDDPLLGHLIALVGRTLTLTVDRATGRVSAVAGADEVIAAVNQRAPAAVPGDPPPLEAQARAAFGAEALARLWSQILALPAAGDEVPLPAPFTAGALTRTWNGLAWTVALPGGPEAKAPAFELAKDPAPVRGTVTKLAGSGALALANGLPQQATGKLSFTLAIEAMTQPVATENEIGWSLVAK